MANRIKRNVKRTNVWGRVFLSGPSGSGKTRGAFELASKLYDGKLPIVLANTEPNRGELYADRFAIEALIDIESDYHPDRFVEAIDDAEQIAPGGILILDSATHEWYGTNGVTQLASRFGDWAKARPLHQKFVDRLQTAQMHVIVCCRAKMKYEQVEVDGRQQVITLGIGPMQDADFPYEFSLTGQIDRASHEVEWAGHIDALDGKTSNLVEDAIPLADVITGWLSEGDPVAAPEEADPAVVEELLATLTVWREEGNRALTDDAIEATFTKARRANRGAISPEWAAEQLVKAKAGLEALRAKKAAAA